MNVKSVSYEFDNFQNANISAKNIEKSTAIRRFRAKLSREISSDLIYLRIAELVMPRKVCQFKVKAKVNFARIYI